MGFKFMNEEQKIRIALSQRAYNIIQEDMSIFRSKSSTNFINTILENFKEESKATFTSYLEHIRNELEKEFNTAKVDQKSKDLLIEHIYTQRKEKTITLLNKYMKEKAFSKLYRINNNNTDYLMNDCEENDFYNDRPGLYIKCILEEYADLPFIERERIYRKDVFNTVELACSNNQAMKVIVSYQGKRKALTVYPYKIMPDAMNSQLFLACYTYEQGQTTKDKKDASFSMARIPMPTLLKQKAFISKEEQKKIDEDIEKLSINYLLGEESEIHVRLTEKGKNTYHNYITSRPAKDEILSSENEYVFHCSESQAFNYFYSFGENAEIISPDSLRKRMIESHQNAIKMYTHR